MNLQVLESAYDEFMGLLATQLNAPIPETAQIIADKHHIPINALWDYCDYKEGYSTSPTTEQIN